MEYFGHNNTTRKLLVSIMDFLSRIEIEKYKWESTFSHRRNYKVPVCYISREKALQIYSSSSARKTMPPEASDAPVEMQWILPRIAVNLTGIVYDTDRHVNKINKVPTGVSESVNAPVPYNLEIEVTSISKTADDAFQIMEQIVPYFTPGLSLDVKIYNDMPESIPFVLNNVNFDFPTEVDEISERLYTVNYYFTLRANYYLQKKAQVGRIETLNVNVNGLDANGNFISQIDGIHFHIQEDETIFEQYKLNAYDPYPSFNTSSTITDTTKITLKRRGTWASTETYNPYDLVVYNGNYFVWINKNSSNVEPGTVPTWKNSWTYLSVVARQTIEYNNDSQVIEELAQGIGNEELELTLVV